MVGFAIVCSIPSSPLVEYLVDCRIRTRLEFFATRKHAEVPQDPFGVPPRSKAVACVPPFVSPNGLEEPVPLEDKGASGSPSGFQRGMVKTIFTATVAPVTAQPPDDAASRYRHRTNQRVKAKFGWTGP